MCLEEYIRDNNYELVNANDKEIQESNLLKGIKSFFKREGISIRRFIKYSL